MGFPFFILFGSPLTATINLTLHPPMKVPGDKIVLLVEDDPSARDFLSNALQYLGFHVSACDTVNSASRFLETSNADVILADCNLPERPGTDLVRFSTAQRRDRPVIGMSGEHFKGDEMLQAGASVFLEKPIELEVLRDVISRLVWS
jgi:DNA-binding response OmpR family regulator